MFLDRQIKQLRDQLATFKSFFSGGDFGSSLAEFDLATEQLIGAVFGSSSEMVEAYTYAQLGEAASLINLPEEAPEHGTHDVERESLQQRKRVVESCIADLEARRATITQKPYKRTLIGPRVSSYMSGEIRRIHVDATLREAGRLLREWNVGSLLVEDGHDYVGIITETELSRELAVVGLVPSKATVRTCMRGPIMTIKSFAPIIEVVKLMKEKGTRHVAVTENRMIIGVVSVSDVLRYYSGVV